MAWGSAAHRGGWDGQMQKRQKTLTSMPILKPPPYPKISVLLQYPQTPGIKQVYDILELPNNLYNRINGRGDIFRQERLAHAKNAFTLNELDHATREYTIHVIKILANTILDAGIYGLQK